MQGSMKKRGRKPKLHQFINGAEAKWCNGCRSWLMLDVFTSNLKKWDGLQSRCTSCVYAAGKAWRERRKADPLPQLIVTEKHCPSCDLTLPSSAFPKSRGKRDGLHPYCLACNRSKQAAERARRGEDYREMRRRYRKTESGKRAYNRYRKVFPHKVEAQKLAQLAMKRGELVKPDACGECGRGGIIDAHHDDYLRPLDVRWLCRWCHQEWHRINGEARNAFPGQAGPIGQIARA